jgi:hypothetical protein
MADAKKKNLYHSELVQKGPVRVTVKTDVMKSKFAGKPPYIVLAFDGEGERNYSIESDDCQTALANMKGRSIMIEATGSGRDGSAAIKVLGAGAPQGGENQPQPPGAAPEPQKQAHTAPEQPKAPQAAPAARTDSPAERVLKYKKFIARRGNALALAATESVRTVETFLKLNGLPFPDATRQAMVEDIATKLTQTSFTTLFITADRAGQIDDFPASGLVEVVQWIKENAAKNQTH